MGHSFYTIHTHSMYRGIQAYATQQRFLEFSQVYKSCNITQHRCLNDNTVQDRLLQVCAPSYNAARIVLEAPRQSNSSPLLRTLHWLPVQQRINYKVALLTFNVRSTSTPSYTPRLIEDRQHTHNLRLATTTLCQPSTTFAKRA